MEGWKRVRWALIYGIFYLCLFFYIEDKIEKVNIIHSKIDDCIPFCEYFIVPYCLWYLFIAVVIVYFAFFNKSRQEYYSLLTNLGIGMTLFLIISCIYPNGHNLRPNLMGDNLFQRAVLFLYSIDTPTNIFPSIHVFNSLACCIAVVKNETCRRHKVLIFFTVLLTFLIVMSTVLLKQHSVFDVLGAMAMCCMLYPIAYPFSLRVFIKDIKTST